MSDTRPAAQPRTAQRTRSTSESTVEVQVPAGWQTLRADRDLLVVATRPLRNRDLALALLARDDSSFAAFPPDATVFVVGHVPAYPSARKMEGAGGRAGTGEENRRHWVPLFERHRVPVVLEHHDHAFKRTKPLLGGLADPNGVLYLGDGSWGRLRPPKSPEKMSVLAASSMDYHLSLHRLQGDERFLGVSLAVGAADTEAGLADVGVRAERDLVASGKRPEL